MESFLRTGKLGSDGQQASSSSATSKASAPSRPVPWVEKYRPRTVTDVAHQEEVVSVLKNALGGADFPNLLFYGPPGTGKTSTILAAARDLFGSEAYKSRVLELNASDERGIAVVRDKIKSFAQLTVSSGNGKLPQFKIVILDEADSMTRDAQSALRRTMEKEGRVTRFCLVCNYISRIIEPITSRCAKFRFKPLSDLALKTRLQMIADKENVDLADEEVMDALVTTCEGDLRKAITTLQSCSRLNQSVSKDDVYEVSGVIPDKWVDNLLNNVCTSGSFEKVQTYSDDLVAEGFSAAQLIFQVHERVVDMDSLSDQQKSSICERLAVAESRLLDGSSEYLQVLDVATHISSQIAKGA